MVFNPCPFCGDPVSVRESESPKLFKIEHACPVLGTTIETTWLENEIDVAECWNHRAPGGDSGVNLKAWEKYGPFLSLLRAAKRYDPALSERADRAEKMLIESGDYSEVKAIASEVHSRAANEREKAVDAELFRAAQATHGRRKKDRAGDS